MSRDLWLRKLLQNNRSDFVTKSEVWFLCYLRMMTKNIPKYKHCTDEDQN